MFADAVRNPQVTSRRREGYQLAGSFNHTAGVMKAGKGSIVQSEGLQALY